MFYREVAKDGRIYVFAIGKRFDGFEKSGGAEIGVAITRLGYGPNGETVVFDSEDAINLYNFKHDKPGEVFPKPKEAPSRRYPSGKISGLVFGDFYYFSDHHDPKFDGQQGFWIRRAYFGYEHTFSENPERPASARDEQQRRARRRQPGALRQGRYVTGSTTASSRRASASRPPSRSTLRRAFWGLRHIEKTPADLYAIDSSRDFGLTLSGPIGDGRASATASSSATTPATAPRPTSSRPSGSSACTTPSRGCAWRATSTTASARATRTALPPRACSDTRRQDVPPGR